MGTESQETFPARRALIQAGVLLAALAAAWPLLNHAGLLNTRGGGDSPFLLQRLHQLAVALHDGHFPVRWMPDANYGFGYPFYNYYAPLSIYVAAAFHMLGFSYVHAIELTQVLGFLIAAWGVYHLASRWLKSEWAGLLSAVAYTVAPFHMVNVYVRGDSLAEFWAMALYPLVLLAADDLMAANGSQKRSVVLLALGYAALILTHNISALIFTPFMLLYIFMRAARSSRSFLHLLRAPALGLALGLAISAWFWLPALAERTQVQMGPVTAGYFHFSNHFWNANLIQPSFFFDYEVAGRNAFRMGLVQCAGIVLGMLALFRHFRRQRSLETGSSATTTFAIFAVAALLVATFMITPLSRPLWEMLPLLPFAQFPWRFLSVQALVGAILTGGLAFLPGRRPIGIGLVVGTAILLLVTSLGRLETDHLAVVDDMVTPERLAQYEWFTGNIGTTVSAEYLPQTVRPRPFTSAWVEQGKRNRTQILAGRAEAQLIDRQATRQTWEVTAGDEGATIVLPTTQWPGWTAAVDGEEAFVRPAPGSGLITLDVAAGAHTVMLALRRTPIRMAAEWLSLAALLIAVAILAASFRHRGGPSPTALRSTIWFILLPMFLVGLFLGLRSAPLRERAPLNWDFAQMAYLHPEPGGIRFNSDRRSGEGPRLRSYRYRERSVKPGETLRVTVEWDAATVGEERATLELVTPAVHRFQDAPPLVVRSLALAGGTTTFSLPIPATAPAGLYVPRLTVEGARPLLPSGETRGNLFLRPLRITHPSNHESEAGTARRLQARADRVTLSGQAPVIGTDSGLFDCASGEPAAARLLLSLSWHTQAPLSRNLTASLRLADAGGLELAQCDVQPGYGYQPSSIWPAGQWVHDLLALPLPDRLPPASPYALLVRLYDAQGQTVLTRRLGELHWNNGTLAFRHTQPTFTLPAGITEATVSFGSIIALRGYRLEENADSLGLTLYWEAMAAGQADYVRFVHLVDLTTGQIVRRGDGTTVQADSIPRNGSYPTSQWSAGEIVADPVVLSLEGVPPGRYRLAVGFYSAQDPGARLPATGPQGQALPDNNILIPESIDVGP